MAQLRSCYFCGTTGALSAYEALPPALVSDDTESPRVVLCTRCHTKLTTVLEPVVDRLDRTNTGDGPAPTAPVPAESAHASGAEPRASGEDDDAPSESVGSDRRDQPEVTFSAAPTAKGDGTAAPDSTHERSATDRPGAAATGVDTAGGASETTPGATDAGTNERDSEGSHTTDEPEEEVAATGSTGTSSAVDSSTDDAAGGSGDEHAESVNEAAASDSPDLDRVYHKLLRFLRNREFPIPRAEAEAVAQSAYDLTATEASRVIQRTLDRGVLEERDGELHRT